MDRLSSSLQKQLQEALSALPNPVTLAIFTRGAVQDGECQACDDALDLLHEVTSHSGERVHVQHYDLNRDSAIAEQFAIDKAPAIVVLGGSDGQTDFGIRIFGAPDGYEFATLVEDIRMASWGKADLMPGTLDLLAHLTSTLHIQVFVTPTCPYCPRAAVMAHRMALASDKVVADVIDATEFPDLADRFHVRGVPRTVVNGKVAIEGAVPEQAFIAHLPPLFEHTIRPESAT